MNDEVLNKIYSIRERIAEECGYDFKKLGERINDCKRTVRPSCW